MERQVFFNGRPLSQVDPGGAFFAAVDCPHRGERVEFTRRQPAYKCPLCAGLFDVSDETLETRKLVDSVEFQDGIVIDDALRFG